MKKHISATQPQNQESGCDDTGQSTGKIVQPTQIVTLAYSFEKRDQSWYPTSDVPTDLSIQVEEITFYVHKYALLSKSGYIGRVDYHPTNSDLGYDIKLNNFPGGPTTFEVVLKFCYGLPIDLSPTNVAPLRCASEFLEMTEEYEDGNLISKTEAFLTFIVLASWRDSIMVLKTCESLSPWAENLQIVRRCCDTISWKVFQDKETTRELNDDEAWYYAERWLPCVDGKIQAQTGQWQGKNELHLSIVSGRNQEGNIGQNREQKMIIESLISILPPQKEAVPCKFLLWMLKMAMVYSVTPPLISELEKRVGLVLQDANVEDLLIPNCDNRDQGLMASPEERTMHNIDTVHRILEYYLMHEEQRQEQQQMFKNLDVSKLLDNYLAEIATDPKLTITKFHALAEALPENARVCHDGLYRAIDVYLKSHTSLPEHDRRRLCRLMNCQKLSFDACMHVAQNDRLPMKTVIQVLFSEQVKMRAAMQGKEQTNSGDNREDEESWTTAKREIKTLKTELEKVKEKMSELQRDYSELQSEYEKHINKQRSTTGWIFGWKKIRNVYRPNGKVDADMEEGQERSSRRVSANLRRRQSMS